MLEAFGIDQSAETVYLAMLRQPDAGTGTLAESLGWTVDQVKAALDELARMSLLRPSWEDPDLLRPVVPEVGLELLLARQRAELLRHQHRIEEGRAAIETLVAEYGAVRASAIARPQVDELIGIDAVRDALERITYETRSEVLAFSPDGAQRAETLAASRPLNEQLLSRGVQMRTIYLTSARNDPPTTTHACWLVEMGAQVRTTPILPLRMLIVDRACAVVPLDPARTANGACVVRGSGTITAMCALFELHWQRATPWGSSARQRDPALTDQERALLNLLFGGYTDEQAARKLGVSTRTVGRMIAEVMTRLGARSRFQAGALAAEKGWLDHEPRPS